MKEADLYRQLAQRHGHYCPMSTLGLRLGLETVRRLADVDLVGWRFCYQARTCAVDGLLLAFENSSLSTELHVDQRGQHLLLCESADGKELSFCLSPVALQLAVQYRELDEEAQPEHLELLRSVAVEQIIEVQGLLTDV